MNKFFTGDQYDKFGNNIPGNDYHICPGNDSCWCFIPEKGADA